MITDSVDIHLTETLVKQMTWKSQVCQQVSVAIVTVMLTSPGDVFPDEVDLEFVTDSDCNVIGTVWKNLAKQGIVKRGTRFRRSKRARGRTIFAYRLVSKILAETFLRRNNAVPPLEKQPELF